MQQQPRYRTIALLEQGIGAANAELVRGTLGATYTQHNPQVPDGPQAVIGWVESLRQASADQRPKIKVVRTVVDGPFVVAHGEYDWGGKKAVFDVFRFEDGKAVEHWDAIQSQPATTASGRTMLDRPTAATDPGSTEANKALVRAFVDDILVNGRFDKLPGYFDGDRYLQHNPGIPDNLSGLSLALGALAKQGIAVRYDDVKRVLGEGSFVFVQSRGSFGGKPVVFYDLFRVEDGKIAEHWDVIQEIPAQAANGNGML